MNTRSPAQRLLQITGLLGLLLLAAPASHAAIGDHIWSKSYPTGADVAIDGSDQLVMHGAFFGTIDLGGGPFTAVNFLDGDQYLARMDANGNHVWSAQFTPNGPGASDEIVAVDPAGNIYITGRLFINTDIDYGGGMLFGDNMYIAKFNSSGVHQWSATYGSGRPEAIVATNTHVVVTGFTSTGLDFGGGSIGLAGGNDVFVAQLTSAGVHSWSAGYGDAAEQGGMAITVDSGGNVLIAASVFGTTDFGGGGLVANGQDLSLAKFTSAGTHVWSQIFDGLFTPGGGILQGVFVAAGPSNELAVAGEMLNSVDFGGGVLTSSGFGDAYIAKFDSNGNHQWSANYGVSTGTEQARTVAIDSGGNVLLAANMVNDTWFGGDTLQFVGDPLNFDSNIGIALYNASGTHLFSTNYGPKASVVEGMFDSTDQIVLEGFASAPGIDFGGGAVTGQYIAKLEGAAGPPTGIGDTPLRSFAALRAYPNPFNPVTTIEYELENAGFAGMAVYDVTGRRVEQLVTRSWHTAGPHTATFSPNASGVYFVKLTHAGATRTIKTVAIK